MQIRLVRSGGESYMFLCTARGETGWVPGDITVYDLWRAITNSV